MKLKVYISIIALVISVNANAQRSIERTMRSVEERAESISKDLEISKEKAMDLIRAMQPIDAKIASLLADTLMDRKIRHQRLIALSNEKRRKVNMLLTAEQQQKMQAIIKARNAGQYERIKQREEIIRKKMEAMSAAHADSIKRKEESKH